MPVNNGQALWKPYESELGRTLRIHAANPGLSQINLGRKNLFSFKDSYFYPQPGHRIPPEECEAYRLSNEHRWRVFNHRDSDSGNSVCTLCARLGFHSWLFNVAWLNRCPVHDVPLECGHTLNAVTRLLLKSKEADLNQYGGKAELREALFSPLPYFKALCPLARFCHLDDAITPVHLFNPIAGEYALTEHNSIFACSELYPSLMQALFPENWAMIAGLGVPVSKLIKVEVPRYPIPDLSRFYLTHLRIRCHYIRESVRKRILRLIKSKSLKRLTDSEIGKSVVYEHFHEDMDILS